MNIVYIHTHDSGRYFQPYGHSIPSPNIMKLAEQGVLFRNAYCASPGCSPSRSAMLTGMSAHSCGMLGLAHRGFKLNDYNKHLVAYLNQHGYETALCGFQHEAPQKEWIAYQEILHNRDEPEVSGEAFKAWDIENAHSAANFIKKRHNKPFFLSYGMMNTHRPFPEADPGINPDYVMPPFPVCDRPENRVDTTAFISSVKIADMCAGIVLDAIKESGMEEDTIVVFTTDHGAPFPKMKCHLYDTGIGVAMIWKCPGKIQSGIVSDGLVSQVDVFPTLCDLLGFKKPDWLEGTSFHSLLLGKTYNIREEVFAELTFHSSYDPMRCIRTERYKLIKYFGSNNRTVHLGGDGGISQKFSEAHGILDHDRDKEMLFDLFLDPVERVNLVSDDRFKDIYIDLSERLHAWMRQTADPILVGTIVPPEGALVNPVK